MSRETIVSLRAREVPGITFHGRLLDETKMGWWILEVFDDTFRVKYEDRHLFMSKSYWAEYARIEREEEP